MFPEEFDSDGGREDGKEGGGRRATDLIILDAINQFTNTFIVIFHVKYPSVVGANKLRLYTVHNDAGYLLFRWPKVAKKKILKSQTLSFLFSFILLN